MGMMKEFREFAMKGNVVDLAVGVIIGAAFGKIVSVLVDKILMPPIGYLTGGIDFKDKVLILSKAAEGSGKPDVVIGWGEAVNAVIYFIIVAFCLFLVIKAMNSAKRRAPAPPPPPPPGPTKEELLLTEIRDLLAAKR